jgi:4a-hydroxytetrahydrobiopterin dehydratase
MSDNAQVLNATDLDTILRELPDWGVRDGKLVREWRFPDFNEAMLFVNRVAAVAERANHHPDIDVRYNRVLLGLVSHDAGGITKRDAAMARELNEVIAI